MAARLEKRKGGGGGGHGGGGRSKSSSSGGKSRPGAFSTGIANGRTASPKSNGGGTPLVLKSGPYTGRPVGGGTRSQVYGDMRYGSGYPSGSRSVSGAPFPFGFYPIYIPSPYLHSTDEYSPSIQGFSRPGGDMAAQFIVSNSLGADSGRFYLIGDSSSIPLVQAALVTGCNATNLGEPLTKLVYPIPDGTNTTNYPDATEIIQFYRASSFALALDGFNASTLPETTLFASDALPASVDRTFLECINSTIASTVPIMDPPQKSGLSTSAIVWIIFGSILAAIGLVYVGSLLWGHVKITAADARFAYAWDKKQKQKHKMKQKQMKQMKTLQSKHADDVEVGKPLMSENRASVQTFSTVSSRTSDVTLISPSSPKDLPKYSEEKLMAGIASPTKN